MFAEQGKATVKSTKVTRGSSRYILVIFTRYARSASYKFNEAVEVVYTQSAPMRSCVKQNLRKQVFNHEKAYWQLNNSMNIAQPIATDKIHSVIERLATSYERAVANAEHHSLKEIAKSIKSLHELYNSDGATDGDKIEDNNESVSSLKLENFAFMSCQEAWKFVCPDEETRKNFDYKKHGGEGYGLQFIQS